MKRMLLAVLGCVFATSTFASPIFQNPAFIANTWAPLLVAQSNGTTLSDSDLRRINFYAHRCLEDILALGDTPEALVLQTLRRDIGRLIEAGEKSGLSQQQTADYFQEYVSQNGLNLVPEYLLEPSGKIETRALFQAVILNLAEHKTNIVDIDAINNADLLAIQSINAVVIPNKPELQPEQIETLALPVIEPDADPVTRAILERVRVQDNQWVIEVIQGDSLGQYAAAIYKDRLLFQPIFEANRAVLSSPNILLLGTVLVLPRLE